MLASARNGEATRPIGLPPPELQNPTTRHSRLEECLRQLQEEAEQEAACQAKKIEERKTEANPTDPDSRIMKSHTGFLQGYNGQVIVTGEQVIVAASLAQEANDQHQLLPMLEKMENNLQAIGLQQGPPVLLADAGYCNEENLKKVTNRSTSDRPECFIATKKDWKERKACRELLPPRGRIPRKLTPRQRMERKLRTKRGKALYRLPSQTVEPVFGQIKTCLGCDGLLLRREEATGGEWLLICAAFNMGKYCRWTKVQGQGKA
jgi:hypothetical protein